MTSSSIPPEQMALQFGKATPPADKEQSQAACKHCGAPVEIPQWYSVEELQLHFCSSACRKAWVEESPSFAVRLDLKRFRRGANWSIQARKARERDRFTCQICGVTEEELGRQLDVHHKIPYRSFKSNVEANKLEHLISLCSSCHSRTEVELRETLPLFRKP
jgi:5-methylcytosine-specific restriction endonuclease McrA